VQIIIWKIFMCKSLSALLIVLCLFSFNVLAANNPFAKKNVLNVGKDVAWNIDKKSVRAVKSMPDGNGAFYHLTFNNKQLIVSISSDENGANSKKFNQFEVKDIKIDGKQNSLFKWCLNNQERHNRFLQQGLNVKKDICKINGNAGTFVMQLNKDTLQAMKNGSRLSIMLKLFRTPLELNYDISDFKDMSLALNAKAAPVVIAAPVVKKVTKKKPARKCWAGAPPKYSNIKSVEYNCDDSITKLRAENSVAKQVNKEKEKEIKLAAEQEKKRKLAEDKKQKEVAAKLKQEELLQAEAAAIAASEAKQAKISDEIASKMVGVCEKYWSKGEHRCYCQKYIEYAPKSIQASSTCK